MFIKVPIILEWAANKGFSMCNKSANDANVAMLHCLDNVLHCLDNI